MGSIHSCSGRRNTVRIKLLVCPIIPEQVQERLCLRCSYRIKDNVAHMNLDHANNENLNEIGPERHWNPMVKYMSPIGVYRCDFMCGFLKIQNRQPNVTCSMIPADTSMPTNMNLYRQLGVGYFRMAFGKWLFWCKPIV
jgi:hypothetical protein